MSSSPSLAQSTIDLFQEAARLNRETSCRQGNVIELTPMNAAELMVTADLHGNRLNFDAAMKIAAMEDNPERHLLMQEVCHGGPSYPTGSGCMSHLLLEDVASLKVKYPERFHFLLSNHEMAELTDFPITKANRMLNLSFRCGLQEMYGEAADDVRDSYVEFIRTCPVGVRVGKVFICHSTPENLDQEPLDPTIFEREVEPEDFEPHGDLFRLVWGRDFRDENAEVFAKLVNAEILIHGHEPCETGYATPNRFQIILDCCGREACYVMLPVGKKLSYRDVVELIRRL